MGYAAFTVAALKPLCGAGSSFKNYMQGGAPRRNELRYTQYNQRLNCCTLRYCSLIEKIIGFFRGGEAAKIIRAVALASANRFELASTMHKAKPYYVPADLSFFQNTTVGIYFFNEI